VRIDAGDKVPTDPRAYSGLVFMGGPMSVNDDLPWIGPVLELIRAAVAADVPVLGHCLGGQLMSKALGGEVRWNPVKEIGWCEVAIEESPVAAHWFGNVRRFHAFQWHGETFTIPPRAVRLASSDYCANQAFGLDRHLGLQCHVEMTPELIRTWYRGGRDEIDAARARGWRDSVQSPEQIEAAIATHAANLSAVATRLYDRWVEGLQ
jgi:GMP synthase-like glutamine amidotransferase